MIFTYHDLAIILSKIPIPEVPPDAPRMDDALRNPQVMAALNALNLVPTDYNTAGALAWRQQEMIP